MNGKWSFRLSLLLVALGMLGPQLALAAPPWAKMLTINRVEADPNKSYPLKDENGPWMIMACSFSGEGAERQAKELVLELRKRYRLEAYLHKVHFKLDDPNGPDAGQATTRNRRWKYRKFRDNPNLSKDGALREVAVLVGNYPSIDDPEAQKTLQRIKIAAPECLKAENGKATSQTLAVLRYVQKHVEMPGNQMKDLGPMGHAFVTTNPLLPPDYYAPKGVVDELVLRMNKGVEHSLLDCPGRYTVQVARFTGEVTINQREIEDIQTGRAPKKDREPLAEAAEKANTLTRALRMDGYEAYEFHDRYASIVTVGSFDSVGTTGADGKINLDPQILKIMKHFGGEPIDKPLPGQPAGSIKLKSLVGIYFDLQPIPVEVPKRSISRELARRFSTEDE